MPDVRFNLPNNLGTTLRDAFLNVEEGETLDPERRAPWLRVLAALDEALQEAIPSADSIGNTFHAEQIEGINQLLDGANVPDRIREDSEYPDEPLFPADRVEWLIKDRQAVQEAAGLERTRAALCAQAHVEAVIQPAPQSDIAIRFLDVAAEFMRTGGRITVERQVEMGALVKLEERLTGVQGQQQLNSTQVPRLMESVRDLRADLTPCDGPCVGSSLVSQGKAGICGYGAQCPHQPEPRG